MGLPGTKPVADRSQVRRTNKPEPGTEWREVVDLPHAGPKLPTREDPEWSTEKPREIIGGRAGWPASTLRWWEAVRTMPHAALWSPADWETAFAAAETHARFAEGWKGCATGAELRAREKQLGMTHDARRDLRIRYVPAPDRAAAELPDNVRKLDDFREL